MEEVCTGPDARRTSIVGGATALGDKHPSVFIELRYHLIDVLKARISGTLYRLSYVTLVDVA